jgi:hypothetical protein
LEYKALFVEFVEVIKGFQFLEARQGFLFLILEVQNMFASMNLVANHQLRFGKNRNPCGNTQRMTISIGEMLAKKKGFERDNQKFFFFYTLRYQSHRGVMLG